MNINTDMAELLLRHFIIRSKLLSSLGTISETCWLIMLNLYSCDKHQGQTIDNLSMAMGIEQISLSRYLAVLAEYNFIFDILETDINKQNRFHLTSKARLSIGEILSVMVQDALSSLGK